MRICSERLQIWSIKASPELKLSCMFVRGLLWLGCTTACLSGGCVLVSAALSVVYWLGAPDMWFRSPGWGRVSTVDGWRDWVCLDGLTPWTQKDYGAEICCFHQTFPLHLLTPALLPLTSSPSSISNCVRHFAGFFSSNFRGDRVGGWRQQNHFLLAILCWSV